MARRISCSVVLVVLALLAGCGSTVAPPDSQRSVPPASVTPDATVSIGSDQPGTLPATIPAPGSATATASASAGTAGDPVKSLTATVTIPGSPWAEGFPQVVTVALINRGSRTYRGPVGVATTLTEVGFAASETPNGTVRQVTRTGIGPVLTPGPYVAHPFGTWEKWAVSTVDANVPPRKSRTYRFRISDFRDRLAVSGAYGPAASPVFASPVDLGLVSAPRIGLGAVQLCTYAPGSPRVTTCTAQITLSGVAGHTYSGLRLSFSGRASNSAGPGSVKITVTRGSSTWSTVTANSKAKKQHVYPGVFKLGPKSVRTLTVKYTGVFEPDDVGTDDQGHRLIGIDLKLAGPRSTDILHLTPY